MTRSSIAVLVFFWALALGSAFFPIQVSRFSLKLRAQMIRPNRNAGRLMAPRDLRRAAVFMLVVLAVVTYVVLTTR